MRTAHHLHVAKKISWNIHAVWSEPPHRIQGPFQRSYFISCVLISKTFFFSFNRPWN